MKQALIFLFLLYSVSFSQVYMNINNKDGTTEKIPIDEIRKLTFSNVVSVEDSKLISETLNSFTLLQNYPNPFNPSTTIEYQIPEPGNIKVTIFNIKGEVVKTIEDGFRKSGNYKLNWNSRSHNGSSVASGIYFVQVKHKDNILTKKIMLLK